MDESWQHYAKWKKPEIKGHIMYESIYIYEMSRTGKFIGTENRLKFVVVEGKLGVGANGYGVTKCS